MFTPLILTALLPLNPAHFLRELVSWFIGVLPTALDDPETRACPAPSSFFLILRPTFFWPTRTLEWRFRRFHPHRTRRRFCTGTWTTIPLAPKATIPSTSSPTTATILRARTWTPTIPRAPPWPGTLFQKPNPISPAGLTRETPNPCPRNPYPLKFSRSPGSRQRAFASLPLPDSVIHASRMSLPPKQMLVV